VSCLETEVQKSTTWPHSCAVVTTLRPLKETSLGPSIPNPNIRGNDPGRLIPLLDETMQCQKGWIKSPTDKKLLREVLLPFGMPYGT
jgi:hypothetical protein